MITPRDFSVLTSIDISGVFSLTADVSRNSPEDGCSQSWPAPEELLRDFRIELPCSCDRRCAVVRESVPVAILAPPERENVKALPMACHRLMLGSNARIRR